MKRFSRRFNIKLDHVVGFWHPHVTKKTDTSWDIIIAVSDNVCFLAELG